MVGMNVRSFHIVKVRLASLCVLIASLVGCGGNPVDYPDTAPVTGTVTLDGAPLAGAWVSFVPAEGRPATGQTDADGKYELMYTGTIKGCTLGISTVMIRKESEPENDDSDLMNTLPDRYTGGDSELSADVAAGDNVIDFQLTSD